MITVRALLFDTVGTLLDWRGGLIAIRMNGGRHAILLPTGPR